MLDFDKNELCVGCSACSCACPVSAVRMVNSERGFYISEVDESKCVKCGKCEKVCPVLLPPEASFIEVRGVLW